MPKKEPVYNKPANMPIKEFITQRIAEEMKFPKSTVDAVISDQFKGMMKAFQTCKSVEMTGFGKWVFLERKAEKQLARLEEMLRLIDEGQPISSMKTLYKKREEIEKDFHTLKARVETTQTKDVCSENTSSK